MKKAIVFLSAMLLGVFYVAGEATAQQADSWWSWAGSQVQESPENRSPRGTTINRGEGRTGSGRTPADRGERERVEENRRYPAGEPVYGGGQAKNRKSVGSGPPFCSNGRGHPVHGMQWCHEKGFGAGVYAPRWEQRPWEVFLPQPTNRRGYEDQGTLMDVLGGVIFGRLDDQRRVLGSSEPLTGRWLQLENGARALQVRSGSRPVAEFTDLTSDGRVNIALVNGAR